jgi:subtilisin family serine protease
VYHDFGGGIEEKFADAVSTLIENGADIIIDDVSFLGMPYFEDGTTVQEIQSLLRKNPEVIYMTAAGNAGDRHYQSEFIDDGEGFHSFNGKSGIPVEIQPGVIISMYLQWDDRFGDAKKDYDLYLFDKYNDKIVASSEGVQKDTRDPVEKLNYVNSGDKTQNLEIRIQRKTGEDNSPNILEIILNYSKDKVAIPSEFLSPEDSIFGHAAIPEVITLSAVESDNSPSLYLSQGPVTIRYPNPEVRRKPDITGISMVSVTGSGNFPKTFIGTAAAVPHIAGLVALERSLFPTASPEQVKTAMFESASDIGAEGWDPVYGHGIPDAVAMYVSLSKLQDSVAIIDKHIEPTKEPTKVPTPKPTQTQTTEPTNEPTNVPTPKPTQTQTAEPTKEPSVKVNDTFGGLSEDAQAPIQYNKNGYDKDEIYMILGCDDEELCEFCIDIDRDNVCTQNDCAILWIDSREEGDSCIDCNWDGICDDIWTGSSGTFENW